MSDDADAPRVADDDVFLRPYLPAEPHLWPAWLGCLHYALGEADILTAFRRDTGNTWTPGRPGIERMIDQATGAERAFFAAFAAWMNAHIWGEV